MKGLGSGARSSKKQNLCLGQGKAGADGMAEAHADLRKEMEKTRTKHLYSSEKQGS